MRAGSQLRWLLGAACLAAAVAAHAEFKDDYALGLKALDKGRYLDARRYLDKALAAQGEPVDKIILNGSIEQPYIPYHFLGLVALKLGDCDLAKAQWSNPMNARMLGRLNQIRQQEQRLLAGCQPKALTADTAQKSTNAEPPPPVPAPVAEPPPVAATPPPVASVEKPAARKPPADKVAPAEESKAAEAAKPAGPPSRLVQAFDNYLAGRYDAAARIDPVSLTGTRARFHALLIRAAARYTQSLIAGNKDLLSAARADAVAAHALVPDAAPDAALFSPRFRAFYAEAH